MLLKDTFSLTDPLSVWQNFITIKDLDLVISHTNLNARADLA